MSTFEIRLDKGLQNLFDEVEGLTNAQGQISNNVEYIRFLEYGTSKMDAQPMVGPYMPEYQQMLLDEMRDAIDLTGGNLQRAINAGVASGTLRITRALADRTPVHTSRAKNAWVATLPNGKTVRSGPEISREQQASLRRAIRRPRR